MSRSRRHGLLVVFCLLALVLACDVGRCEPPARTVAHLLNRRAQPIDSFTVTERQGPWMIFAGAFAGKGAEREAAQLVTELRERWRLPAYTFSEHFDLSQNVRGNGLDLDGNPKIMQHRLPIEYDEIAVLVGNFPAFNDPKLQETLQFIKHCRPRVLETSIDQNASTLRFAGLRHFHKKLTKNPAKKVKGPLGKAFVTRNPVLPQEFFTPTGLDPLVVKMNDPSDVRFSLLTCPGIYTVRIATFRGTVVIDPREVDRIEKTGQWHSRLDEAAEKAHRIVTELRSRGVEAYEFHDRNESIVTVGSFQSLGIPQADGSLELHPAIHQIIRSYGPSQQPLPGMTAAGVQPRTVAGVILDVQPVPVVVPRQSIAKDYERSNTLWR